MAMAEEKNELIRDEMWDLIVSTVETMVTKQGAHGITVRKVLQELGISNRVFYNRFRNIEEVLETVYNRTVLKIRSIFHFELDPNKDFFEQVLDVVTNALLASYETKRQFNHYVFENDSSKANNYTWWMEEIKKLIEYAVANGFIKDVDTDILSYSIWCFCRGYNADAVARGLPKEEAVRRFRYSFSFLLEGLKK